MINNVALNFHVNKTRGRLTAMEVAFIYNVANLCVKADPLLLLPVIIPVGGGVKLEECAMVTAPDDKHFEIYVTNHQFIPQVTKGIVLKHPELDVSMKEKEADEDPDVLIVKVPEMTKERRDTLKDVIKVKYEQMKTEMEKEYAKSTSEASSVASKVKPEELQECKDALQNVHNEMLGGLKKEYDGIIKYIEDEYKAYSTGDVEKQKQEEEDNAATSDSAAKKMKL